MEKAREFWVLVKDKNGQETVRDMDRECFEYEPEVFGDERLEHVISKSAYDQLLADAREMQKALEKIDGNFGDWDLATKAAETFKKKYGEK